MSENAQRNIQTADFKSDGRYDLEDQSARNAGLDLYNAIKNQIDKTGRSKEEAYISFLEGLEIDIVDSIKDKQASIDDLKRRFADRKIILLRELDPKKVIVSGPDLNGNYIFTLGEMKGLTNKKGTLESTLYREIAGPDLNGFYLGVDSCGKKQLFSFKNNKGTLESKKSDKYNEINGPDDFGNYIASHTILKESDVKEIRYGEKCEGDIGGKKEKLFDVISGKNLDKIISNSKYIQIAEIIEPLSRKKDIISTGYVFETDKKRIIRIKDKGEKNYNDDRGTLYMSMEINGIKDVSNF